MDNIGNKDKRVIGLFGESCFATELHNRGWRVYRALIDDKFDFVIMKSWCKKCNAYRNSLIRETIREVKNRPPKRHKTVTQLCEVCESDSLVMNVRFIQVKTSEGTLGRNTKPGEEETRQFDFHAKIRYHLADDRIFYAWIQVWDADSHDVNYFIFRTADVAHFDSLDLDSYQVTDNQKTRLRITRDGKVKNRGRVHLYDAFDGFLDDFECLE